MVTCQNRDVLKLVSVGLSSDHCYFHEEIEQDIEMTTKSLIAQKLLDWYEERELLWNITCEEYRFRNKKNAAYKEIATELGISGSIELTLL